MTTNAGFTNHLAVAEFDYTLPADLIAQCPVPDRDAARLMVLDRGQRSIQHSCFRELGDWLEPGDLLVGNNSRVIPARLLARREDTGGRVELLLLRPEGQSVWSALAKPARRLKPGLRLLITPRMGADAVEVPVQVRENTGRGEIVIAVDEQLIGRLDDYGSIPLPPYITARAGEMDRYQTVYSSVSGSAAAPTAGLHFTPKLLADLRDRGIGWSEVTLHIGLDTFRPVSTETVSEHTIHQEWCSVSDETARRIAEAKAAGHRVVAVGTTVARTLETLAAHWQATETSGMAALTDIFIVPGYDWRLVDGMITNFHLPKSTLLMMVSSFAGSAFIREAYEVAIAERYRFYSFGDASLIL